MNLKIDSENPRGCWTSVFHEIGHSVDRATDQISTRTGLFKTLLVDDFESLVKNYQMYYSVNKQEAYRELSESLQSPEYHIISDLFGGLTNNECMGHYGYRNEGYWKKPGKLEKEAFAHFFEALARNDAVKIETVKSVFPNAFGEFIRLLEEL